MKKWPRIAGEFISAFERIMRREIPKPTDIDLGTVDMMTRIGREAQPCGHPLSAIDGSEPSFYCSMCEKENAVMVDDEVMELLPLDSKDGVLVQIIDGKGSGAVLRIKRNTGCQHENMKWDERTKDYACECGLHR